MNDDDILLGTDIQQKNDSTELLSVSFVNGCGNSSYEPPLVSISSQEDGAQNPLKVVTDFSSLFKKLS